MAKSGLASLLIIITAATAALTPADSAAQGSGKVDPALLGMWKLAVPGMSIFWHVRADGSYRYFGVNARPFEHWGTMEASGGRWSSRWAGGVDGGSYSVSGKSWQSNGKAGIGNWQRIWKPGDGGSQGQCPLIDVAEVEALVGSATRGRASAGGCELTVGGVGYSDGVKVSVIENAAGRFANVRKQHGAMRAVVDVPGIGDAAFLDGDSAHILKGGRYAVLTAGVYPTDPNAVSDAALTRLARSVAARL